MGEPVGVVELVLTDDEGEFRVPAEAVFLEEIDGLPGEWQITLFGADPGVAREFLEGPYEAQLVTEVGQSVSGTVVSTHTDFDGIFTVRFDFEPEEQPLVLERPATSEEDEDVEFNPDELQPGEEFDSDESDDEDPEF